MKNRNYFFCFVLIFTAFCLFSTCKDLNTPTVYKVSFKANGGTPVPSDQNVIQGDKVKEPAVMTKTGYGFAGWYKEVEFINQWNFAVDTVNRNTSLFAKWDINYHTVDFEANGGFPVPNQQNIAYGSKVVTPPAMTKTGYTFDGWYKDEALTNLWDISNNIVLNNTTLYAKWLENFIVTFEASGGIPQPVSQTIANGYKIVKPDNMTKTGFTFDGWYKEATFINIWDFEHDIITANTTLYAKWNPPILVPGTSWNAKMRWLDTNVQSYNDYIIELDSNESSTNNITFYFSGKTNISITLKGIGAIPIIINSIIDIKAGVTLILENNLELRNVIMINSGGNLILNNGSRITKSSNGGVVVDSGGTFTMNGGEISGNSYGSSGGGGVYVSGIFTMNGGKISSNTSSRWDNSVTSSISSYGGGVYVSGIFTMNGGEISGNISSTTNSTTYSYSASCSSYGGGVYVSGTFTMNDGKISGNTSSSNFTNISSSSTSSYGGGVYVSGTFTMNGGEISGNIATISSSTSFSSYGVYGGGVYVEGSFNKTGGIIYGYTEGNSDSNVVKDVSGVVQQNQGHAIYSYHSNSVYRMGKDSTSGTTNNLSFNGKVNPPAWSGEWDF